MENDSRYKRHQLLPEIGTAGQIALNKSKVLVVGAGGLGNAAIPYLVGSGVGEITIVDHDKIELSNLQRQVVFDETDVGLHKAVVMANKMRRLNSSVTVNYLTKRLNADIGPELARNHDVIIDCTDDIPTRYLINDLCVEMNIPMVYGALHRFEGQVATFNFNNGATYRCAFPENEKALSATCEEAGVIGVLPGLIGVYQAMEVVKIITGAGEVLSNKLLMINMLNNSQIIIEVERSTKLREKRVIRNTSTSIADISDWQKHSSIAVDLRDFSDSEQFQGLPVLHIPAYELEHKMHTLKQYSKVLFFCEKGQKSSWAVQLAESKGLNNIYQIEGGLQLAQQNYE